ncbi:MAG: DNA-processing protein DprA [Rhodobacteraceae bacterium]|nr:DNA-processing protein DprA [Paracoccaceae bacterium]
MTGDINSSTHPLLPPTTEDERVSWLRLLRSRRVGVVTFYRLMAQHGSADAALQALPEVASAAGVKGYRPCPEGVVRAELASARQAGAKLVCRGDAHYPAGLLDLDDAPPMLWVVGDLAGLSRPMVAMVGARNASSLGGRMAKALAEELSENGFTIVSGMARGIDTVAHRASLSGGTVAVLAGGVDVPYPSENTVLADDIVSHGGARVSEAPMGLQPQARHFPARNRIISGLAQAVVVVEAAAKSGTLITARAALDQGREVLAVPGHPFDARASGCNLLIRDGAKLVRSAQDVIEALPAPRAEPEQPPLDLHPPDPVQEPCSTEKTAQLHQQILCQLGPSPLAEDQLIRDIGLPPSRISPALTDLELEGRIIRQPGGLLCRADGAPS